MDMLTNSEKEIINLYRQLDSEDKGEVKGIIEALVMTSKRGIMTILALSKQKEALFM